MATLLYIEASPRKARSKSIKVAQAFLTAYRETHPDDEVVTLDLWDAELPEFDGYTIDAKYQVLHGQDFDDDQAAAWQVVVDVCQQFTSADKYAISLPMWNFGIPYKLKHYIDVIAQPGQTFSFSPGTGYAGLVTGKPIVTIYARGGAYTADEAKGMDFQKNYLEFMLRFLGFKNIHDVVIEPTLASPDAVKQTEQAAIAAVTELASRI